MYEFTKKSSDSYVSKSHDQQGNILARSTNKHYVWSQLMVKINVYSVVQICSQQGTGGKTFDLKLTKVPC